MSLPRSIKVGAVTAGEQPTGAELGALKEQGFKSVVSLRERDESSHGLTPEQEGRLASELGLAFVNLPISVASLSAKDVETFGKIVETLPAPVYVHCGLGQRAATLALLADAEGSAPASATIAAADQQGIAITPAVRAFINRYLDDKQEEPRRTLVGG